MVERRMPPVEAMRWPVLKALKALGGSASVDELEGKVAQVLRLDGRRLGALHRGGPRTEFSYRLAWARTFLKGAGAIENSDRGVWTLTPVGARQTQSSMGALAAKVRAAGPTGGKAGAGKKSRRQPTAEVNDPEGWKDALLGALKQITPEQFEILSKRLLRESGLGNVELTSKKPGDEGIDGHGTLQMNLVSFRVAFQCKRWKGSVGAPAVRDFRGAMAGRAEKGVIITTSHFTPEAVKEARREGAWVIDLIDGEGLCTLLKRFGWGVQSRPMEQISVDPSWFGSNLVS